MSEPFIGEVRMVGFNFAPRGWALCNGQLLPIAQNTALFSLLGTTYGGDGRSTFGLPDLRDRGPMHAGRGPGLTERRLGEKINNPDSSRVSAVSDASVARGLASSAQRSSFDAYPVDSETDGHRPALVVNFAIALVGLYPSRS